MASKNVYCDYTATYYTTPSAYTLDGDSPNLYAYDYATYRCGRIEFPSLAIGAGTLNSATLYLRTYFDYDGQKTQLRIAASNTATAHTTAISSGYSSFTKYPYFDTYESFDVTSLINGMSDFNDTFYIFGIRMSPAYSDGNRGYQYRGYYHDGVSPHSLYKPYLAIDYTPVNSTIGLYDTTTSTWNNRIIKKRVAGAWVDCDCYKYNGATWDKVSTT
jgi:hypothetical protein